ncbi:Na(+)-translocating NADH-quinone reductase subunit C [Porphyromonas sp. COT-108 OH2963]|uniref:Na(+)-translocating NADH-quinone reductase subunit C n=1 Tax=Porphyromonas canoris TaxID=36875 RepID=A0ABR4XJT4_9PORP|nr:MULTISPECIES: NADH:ubiquinone reductase (Na(+)-transporting) subunit C [Porphyromonas]KGN91710.1 Na(+)-translocating NADH-quinone reductase subunit C [Porphyromonas canoris]KGN95708.1 Na(+)-translocating NADH-quinone reductase subunit C [Porphyromonas sp. COT-108 OH2963]
MNRNSNSYTIIYAAVMVILVAVGLAFTSQSLKGRQTANANIDKMQQILKSIKVSATAQNAQAEYGKYIKEAFLVRTNGERVEGSEGTGVKDPAFAADFAKVVREGDKGEYPVFIAEVDGVKKYILAMSGAGLWGPVWGFISINDDTATIYGVDFSHQGETPGLGAQIVEPFFTSAFEGKTIFTDGAFAPVQVVKGGSKLANGVDAISGSTLTSNGVNDMIRDSIKMYQEFLKSNK